MKIAAKLSSLRDYLKSQNIEGLLLSSSDEYGNEYAPPYAKRIQFISEFTGSVSFFTITQNKAAIFVDGRYTEQAKKEIDHKWIEVYDLSLSNIVTWITQNIKTAIATNSKTSPYRLISHFKKSLGNHNIRVDCLNYSPVDKIWTNQPSKPKSLAFIYGLEYAGEDTLSKQNKIRQLMSNAKLNWLIVTSPDDIAWALNIRGQDLDTSPTLLATLLINNAQSLLFIDSDKITPEVSNYLQNYKITCYNEDELENTLVKINNSNIGIAKDSSYYYFDATHKNNNIIFQDSSLIGDLKAIKNNTELEGFKQAHNFDGACLVKTLIELKTSLANNQKTNEIEVANKILHKREKNQYFTGLSFESIVACNANAALPHYHANDKSNSTINNDSILLIDCGGQYLHGTTDVTRTITFKPSDDKVFRNHFSLVLKSFISLSRLVFPKGTTGGQLDAIARSYLWGKGQNYNHGTGHGVGHYLNVHEGPCSLSPGNTKVLDEGMVLSIEPGIYIPSHYGIRIENLVFIKKSKNFSSFLEFEPLTMIPIDTQNIEVGILDDEDIKWLNDYHGLVYQNLNQYFFDEEKAKLQKLTSKLRV